MNTNRWPSSALSLAYSGLVGVHFLYNVAQWTIPVYFRMKSLGLWATRQFHAKSNREKTHIFKENGPPLIQILNANQA